MLFYFRCDSSARIGSGHLMRGLMLASALRERGHESVFLCSPEPGSVYRFAEDAGFMVHLLSTPGLSEEDDAEESFREIAHRGSEDPIVVVDHYSLSKSWESRFFPSSRVVVIDDLANRPHLCHVLIDANYRRASGDPYAALTPAFCERFLGPRHAFLRAEFLRTESRPPRERNGIFVFFGGTDPTGETLKFLRELARVRTAIPFRIVVSKGNSSLEEIRALPLPPNAELYVQPQNVAELMASSRLYFGSGGTITWERFSMGLPGRVVSIADNQTAIARDLAAAGLQDDVGPAAGANYAREVVRCLERHEDFAWLNETARRAAALVGPLDVDRLLGALLEPRLRPAALEDARFLYELRNEASTRAMFISSDEVPYEKHVDWLRARLSGDDPLWIVAHREESVGQVRIDADGSLSVSIHPRGRGRGFAMRAIRLAVEADGRRRPGRRYVAIVKEGNEASLKAFRRAGFADAGTFTKDGRIFHRLETTGRA